MVRYFRLCAFTYLPLTGKRVLALVLALVLAMLELPVRYFAHSPWEPVKQENENKIQPNFKINDTI